AYQGDGKKRRSFLPAPKKSPTSSLPPPPTFPSGASSSSSYTVLQRAYVSKLPGTQSSSSSISPSSSLSSISLPSSSVSSVSLHSSTGEKRGLHRAQYQDENRCGVGLRVGARVKIGGVKPGILRYLGTTHLAPGIFCGIELLEADGNHDGEVNGHRYFYCPPNCGIFAPKEKVCLDASVSSRLSSESDGNLYSSNESLTERTYKAFRSFEEGELEAVDCSALSPEGLREDAGKRKRNEPDTPPDWGSRSTDSIDSQDSSYLQGKPRSRLPRVGRSNIPGPHEQSVKSPESNNPPSLDTYSYGLSSSSGHGKVYGEYHNLQQRLTSCQEGKEGHFYPQEKDHIVSKVRALTKHRSDATEADEREDAGKYSKTTSKHRSKSHNKHFFNFAFDPAEGNQQAIQRDQEVIEQKRRHQKDFEVSGFSHIETGQDKNSTFTRDTEFSTDEENLNATFVTRERSAPSSHSANRTFEIAEGTLNVSRFIEEGQDIPWTSTPEPGHTVSRLRSQARPDQQSPCLYASFSGSDTDVGVGEKRLSVTYSLSDLQVQSNKSQNGDRDRVFATTNEGQQVNLSEGKDPSSTGSVQDRIYHQGGYDSSDLNSCGGDGNSCGFFPSQPQPPSSSCKSASFIVSSKSSDHESDDLKESVSHTVCTEQKIPEIASSSKISAEESNNINANKKGLLENQADSERDRSEEALPDLSSTKSNPLSNPQLSQIETGVVAAAATSLSNIGCRSHTPSPSHRKISSGGSSHEENGESSSSSGPPSSGGGDHRHDHLDDSSTGVSPEVSQALEWDYGQEFADGKIPPPLSRHHLNRHARHHSCDAATIMTTSSSTGTSESLSDALLRDVSSEPSSDAEMTPASSCSLADDSDQFEAPENDFENIDSLEDLDFPMLGKISAMPPTSASSATPTTAGGMTAHRNVMTDSGISERDDSEMFKSTTSAASSSTLCGGGAGDNSFSDDCSREDDHSCSSISANPASGMINSGTLSAGSTKGVSSDSSQETLCVADTPGSLEDKEFLTEDGEADDDTTCPKSAHLKRVDPGNKRSRHDSCGEETDITSGSPVSVVSLEDVSLVQDKTVVCHLEQKKPETSENKNKPATKSCPNDSSSSPNPTGDMKILQGPTWEGLPAVGDEPQLRDPAGLVSVKRERPVSLVSTTSADTGYAPDTDSEIGTLTFNSPNTDWLDRCGVAHPTTFAPQEELGYDVETVGFLREEARNIQRTSTPLAQKDAGANDVNESNPIAAEEDDRIEADQLYGCPPASGTSGPHIPQPGRVSPISDDRCSSNVPASSNSGGDIEPTLSSGAPSVDAPSEEEGLDDYEPCQDIEFSFKVNAPIDFVAADISAEISDGEEGDGDGGKDAVKRNPKRKVMTITKKRSENVSHKMPNTSKVTSRLADYIKTPPAPARPKEEQQKNSSRVTRNNLKNKEEGAPRKRLSAADISVKSNMGNNSPDIRRASSVDKGGAGDGDTSAGKEEDNNKRQQPAPQPPKPIIKRAPPKSKWGDIMSQIESSKGSTKPKPKSEIKSSLAAYLNTPPPSIADKNNQQDCSENGTNDSSANGTNTNNPTPPRKKFESRIKPLPPPPPKIDLSKVKSKLGVPTAASATKAQPKRDASNTSTSRRSVSREGSPAAGSSSARKGSNQGKRMSEPHVLQGKQLKNTITPSSAATTADSSILSSARSSTTDLSLALDQGDADGAPSKRGSVDVSRRLSTNSAKSEVSEKNKNARETAKNGNSRAGRRTIEIKSNAPSNTPLTLPSRAIEIHISSNGSATLGTSTSSRKSTPSPVIVKPVKPKSGTSTAPKTNQQKPAWGSTPTRKSDITSTADKRHNSAGSKLECRSAMVFPLLSLACRPNTNIATIYSRDGLLMIIPFVALNLATSSSHSSLRALSTFFFKPVEC
ncbi:Cap-gly domain-containing linker protein 1, partial [Plakobranchus ocellatus]